MSGERKDLFADVDRHWDAAMGALREHGLDPDEVVAQAAARVNAYAEHSCPSCEGDDGVASGSGRLLGAFPIATSDELTRLREIEAKAKDLCGALGFVRMGDAQPLHDDDSAAVERACEAQDALYYALYPDAT